MMRSLAVVGFSCFSLILAGCSTGPGRLMRVAYTATWFSVIKFAYVTSHGFILLRSRPRAAMLVPPAPQYEPAKNHCQSNPKVRLHYYSTIP
jgi:hypothetical protein